MTSSEAARHLPTTIRLREPKPADAEAVFQAVSESVADVEPWLDWAHERYQLSDAASWIETQRRARNEGSAWEFLIVDENDRVLGTCGVNRVNFELRMANVGYFVRTSAAGRGVAAAAVEQLAAWAFSRTSLVRLEIVVQVDNVRSLRVAEKVGAQREGVLRARLWYRGRPRDAVMYSLIRPSMLG